MICVSGKEVKEVYLGNVPVSAVYIGDRLIWRSRVYMEGAAVIVLSADAQLSFADGACYSEEAVSTAIVRAVAECGAVEVPRIFEVGAPVVCAAPYMRHIAPMLLKSPGGGIYKVMPGEVTADVYGAIENGGGVYEVRGRVLNGAPDSAEHNGVGIHESAGIPASGGAMYAVENGITVEALNITGGEGETSKAIHIGGALQHVSFAPGDGEINGTEELLVTSYNVKTMYGDAENRSADIHVSALLSEIGTLIAPSDSFRCTYQCPTAAAVLKGSDAGTTDTDSADCILPVGSVTVSADTAKDIETSGAAFGICAAAMTTEIYEEPTTAEFDTMLISDMDGLSLSEIDALTILI